MTTDNPPRTIVTFFEQYGAGASTIAPRVAEALGVPYLDQAFSSDALEQAEAADDKQESSFGRLLRSFSPIPQADADLTWALDSRTDDELVVANTSGVLSAVEHGGVILGRSSTAILAGVPGAFHVKLIAPLDQRIARAASEAGLDRARAARRQVREDRVRVEMSRRHYGWDPSTEAPFDLIVNTGRLTPDAAVAVIVAAYRAFAS